MYQTTQSLSIIQQHINQQDYTSASVEFQQLIDTLIDLNDPQLASIYYEYGLFLFDLNQHSAAVSMLIASYHLAYNRESILSFLYECYIIPNQAEFLAAFELQMQQNCNLHLSLFSTYDELPLDFIPVSETEYFIFDKTDQTFQGSIYCDLSHKSDISVKITDEFSDITYVSGWNLAELRPYLLTYSDRMLYYISEDPLKTLSFFKIPQIQTFYLKNTHLFDTIHAYRSYFHTNKEIYLPRLLYIKNSDISSSIQEIIQNEHTYRLTKEGRTTDNIFFSICIPTWNRGHRALNAVTHLLKLSLDAEIEIVVSNNASTKHSEGYQQIKDLEDARITYFEFSSNQGFVLNWIKTIELSHGRFSMLLSDEDDIILCNLPHYLNFLKNHPSLSVLRSSTDKTYAHLHTKYCTMGQDAFLEFFLRNNYLTGIIYNTKLFLQKNFRNLHKTYVQNFAYLTYPHMWWDAIMTFSGDYYQDSTFLCTEGEDEYLIQKNQHELTTSLEFNTTGLHPYTLPESRMQQLLEFIPLLNFLPFDSLELKLGGYLALCTKTELLICCIKEYYLELNMDCNKICQLYYDTCIKGIDILDSALPSTLKGILYNYIASYYDELVSKLCL